MKPSSSKTKPPLLLIIGILTLLAGTWAGAVQIERDVPVPMCDGVILRANVFRPDEPGQHPVLVVRTPYGKKAQADAYVKAGYIPFQRRRTWTASRTKGRGF